MRRFPSSRVIAWTLSVLLPLSFAASSSMLRADDAAPAKEPAAEAPAPPPSEAPAASADEAPVVQPEPERVEDVKLIKIDNTAKSITILIAPGKDKYNRAYKRMKLVLDDKTLIMVDQQPSNLEALQQGMIVDVSWFKKGKLDVVDTVVVKANPEP